ncbi:MFS transporter [Streptomyces goshikiensis]|uniref:MFS transporter n=1 Tax=Streptomyces goshikiensis TaxID=1942 RepID=UPI0036C17BE6
MRKWGPLIAVCLGACILLVDVTIVNVALPSMARDLGASFASLQWVIDAYALALAALLLAAGAFADRHGHRRAYVGGLALFAVASLVCGVAPDAGVLIAARAVQGIGGAAMFATAPALLLASYQGRDRGTAFGLWGAANGAAAAAGPLLGGVLTQRISWPVIFWINLPVAVVAIVLSRRFMAADRPVAVGRKNRIDLPGAATFSVAASALVYGLIRGSDDGWGSPGTLASYAVAALALVAFVVVEHRTAHRGETPMLDLALLRNASFAGLLTGALLLQASAFGCLALLSLWLQSLAGLAPIEAGLALTPLAAASFLVSAVTGRHIQRLSPRLPIGLGLLLAAAGMLLLRAGMSEGASATSLTWGLVVTGLGVGLATPVLVSAATSAVPQQRAGMAGGAINTARQLGMTLAVAVLGAVFASNATNTLTDGEMPHAADAADALASGQANEVIASTPAGHREAAADLAHQAFAAGLDRVFLLSALAAAVGAVAVLLLVRTAPGSGRTAEAAGKVSTPART